MLCPGSGLRSTLVSHIWGTGYRRTNPMQVMDYNVPGGKLNRGMAVYDVIAAIKGAEVRSALAHGCPAWWVCKQQS
jgi:hypothetical protein